MESVHISRIGAGIHSLHPLVSELRGKHVQSLCLHANSISNLESLHMLQGLEDLNLSSNQLRGIDGLHTLTSLTSLNLASNRIFSLDKLQPLSSLQSLILSYNSIAHLSGLSGLQVLSFLSAPVHGTLRPGISTWTLYACVLLFRDAFFSRGRPVLRLTVNALYDIYT